MSRKPRLVRHEFVVNADKDPLVARWIEEPDNVGKVGATIVGLIRLHLWAARNMERREDVRELLQEMQQLAHKVGEVRDSLKEVLDTGGYAPRWQDNSSTSEQHKSALDSL